ncbi:hypothetical protein AOQ84DRAFT_292279 [Glonium stellatum]|uniref:Heterokaryon incompatibility domain-containing protein n=1 Tax=Glonium stellatum TaxID=574774 RepID=A0A8E2JTE8_9PEZI|nr:hypothetical protein AOQ84DRAFT_292279 [Glonium stellatum]
MHAWLDEKLDYEALFYTWGNIHSMDIIDLNGRPFTVRKNLLDALWQLRLRDRPRRLWADALCTGWGINRLKQSKPNR